MATDIKPEEVSAILKEQFAAFESGVKLTKPQKS